MESTLFRYLGSAADALRAAVFEPWRRVLQAWADGALGNPADALGSSLREVVTGLSRLVLANRDLLRSLIAADHTADHWGDHDAAAVAEEIRRQAIAALEESGAGAARDDALFGLVMGTFLLSNWIHRDDLAHLDEDAVVDAIVAMVMQRPPDRTSA